MRYALLISLLMFATAGHVWGQPKRKPLKPKPAAPILNFDEADALFGKRKRTAPRQAHDKYANQEVAYRRKPNKAKLPSKRSQVTHDPEFENWANRKGKRKTR
ncbi:MAG: hypothetical protein JNM09_16170 [Blastocatellia bacterium]|nr:hypothetical protein [Blastocatellia bacterium]